MQTGKRAALLAVILCAACTGGGETPAIVVPLQDVSPTATTMTTAAPPTVPPTPTTTPTTAPADASDAVQAAIDALAQELGVPQPAIGLVEVLPVQWNDSSLGCPAPGEMYLQVITPGYLVTLEVGEETYYVHTDLGGTAIVCAESEEAIGEETPRDPIAAEFVLQARADLAARLGISPDAIVVLSSEAVEWSDTSLGCPEEGFAYATVIVPGYQIVLAVDDQTYAYHTDYQQIFLCEQAGDE